MSPDDGAQLRSPMSLVGTKMATGDIDGDGFSEYALVGNYYILILDDDFSVIRNMSIPYATGVWVQMIDLNHDGKLEVFTYVRNSTLVGRIYLLNYAGVLKWSHPISSLLNNFALADFNNDTIYDIVIPMESYHTLVIDGLYGGLLEVIFDYGVRSYTVAAGDCNNDGVPEVFIGAYNNHIYKFSYKLLGKTFRAGVTTTDFSIKMYNVLNGEPVKMIEFYDFTGDGQNDLLVAGSNMITGIASNGTILFTKEFKESGTLYPVESILVWRETRSYVNIAVSVKGKGIYNYIYWFSTGALTDDWYYKDTLYTAYDMDTFVNQSGVYIVAAVARSSSAGGVYIINSDGILIKHTYLGVPIKVVEVHEFSSGYSGKEIVAYTDNKYLYVYETGSLINIYTYSAKRVNTFSCEDLNGDDEVDIVVGTDDSVTAVSPETKSQLWSYSTSGSVNSVVAVKKLFTQPTYVAAEIDNKEILVLTSSGAKSSTFSAPNLVTSLNTTKQYSTFLYNADITHDGYQDLILISGNRIYAITRISGKLSPVWGTNQYTQDNITALAIGYDNDFVFAVSDTQGAVSLYDLSLTTKAPSTFPQYPSGYGDFSATSANEVETPDSVLPMILITLAVMSVLIASAVLYTRKTKKLYFLLNNKK